MAANEDSLTFSNHNNPVIELSDTLLEGLREVAALRAKNGNRVPVDESHEITNNHFVGLCGEAAVAGYYNLPLNLTYHHPIDPGYDFIVNYTPNNERMKFDVKTRTDIGGSLLVAKKNMRDNADMYMLCLKHNSKVMINGVASTDMIKNSNTIKIGSDLVHKITQEELYNIPNKEDIKHISLDMDGLSSVDVNKKSLITVEER